MNQTNGETIADNEEGRKEVLRGENNKIIHSVTMDISALIIPQIIRKYINREDCMTYKHYIAQITSCKV